MAAKKMRYPAEFINDAVKLTRSSDRSLRQMARELGVNPETLRSWVTKAKLAETTPPEDLTISAETRALRKRVTELEQDNDILRKAAAYFAKEMGR